MSGKVLARGQGCFSEIALPKRELALRLGCQPGAEALDCIQQLEQEIRYRYCYVKVPLIFSSEEHFFMGQLSVTSKLLGKNLRDCKEVYIFAATLGAGADRLISRLGISSPARQFMTDAAASALAEGLCDQVNTLIRNRESGVCRPRFSPGFGDFPLGYQPYLLQLCDAPKQIGVTVTESLFLTPTKSVTAVMGVRINENHG